MSRAAQGDRPGWRLAWRYVSGHYLSAEHPGTDATWFRSGRAPLRHHQRPMRWAYWPRMLRAGIRLGGTLAVALLLLGEAQAPVLTNSLLGLGAAGGLGRVGWLGVRAIRQWRHRRTYVAPLRVALAPYLGGRPEVSVPLGHDTREDAVVRVELPPNFYASKETKALVTGIVSSKLGLVGVDSSFDMIGAKPSASFKRRPSPPALVPFGELAAEAAACKPGEIILGLDQRHEIFRGSWLIEDPHWGCSCGSRRGKSTMLQLTAAQLLAQDPGATVTGIDPKMVSLAPLAGIPGVTLANDPRDVPAMWDTIGRFRAEMDRRMDLLNADPTASFPFNLLVIDELNMFAAMSAAVWRTQRDAKAGDPAVAPVWMDIASCLWQGAQLRCHVILVGQRLDDRATGGIGLRDSLGLRGLAGFTPQQYVMLVGSTPVPKSSKHRGRWLYSDGEELTWVQNAYLSPEAIRDYALAGRRPGTGSELAGAGSTGSGSPDVWLVGMDAAAEYLGLKVEAFKTRRRRAGGAVPGETRQGGRLAWRASDLDSWTTPDREVSRP